MRHIEPKTAPLPLLPSGVAIFEIGINVKGEVVSACVVRGVRSDFDRASQEALLQWRWKLPNMTGSERGFVQYVTVCTPDTRCDTRPRDR